MSGRPFRSTRSTSIPESHRIPGIETRLTSRAVPRLSASLVVALVAAATAPPVRVASAQSGVRAPVLNTLRFDELSRAKARLQAGDSVLRPAYDRLLKEADAALHAGPFSVMQKKRIPPSGDRHDYVSMGPYWWPDPSKPNGLPYIRKDGQRNP